MANQMNFVQTWYGIDQEYTCLQNGTTGGNGSAYLECWIPEQYSMGLDFMVANMTDQGYTIISSQNTFTSTASAIYLIFDIGIDVDGNDIVDAWEMPLAQKFFPALFQPAQDSGTYWGATGGNYTLRQFLSRLWTATGQRVNQMGFLTIMMFESKFMMPAA